MPAKPSHDAALVELAAPLRVIAVADLVGLGMSSGTIARRCRSGIWLPILSGVVVMHGGTPTRRQEVEAARLYAGPDAVVTGHEALRRYGLSRLPQAREVMLLVPAGRRRRGSDLAHVVRTERMPDPVERDGVPLAPFDRAMTDTVRALRQRDEIRALVAEAVGKRRTTVARLRLELDAGDQRHSGLPREVLAEADDGMRSASEGWARDLHARSDLPPVMWNPELVLPGGRFLARPDGWFDDVGLVWESDSWEFHPDGDDATARRRADLVGAGIVVVSHRPRRFKIEPERVVQELWHHYRLAASRPRPAVTAIPCGP